MSTEFTVNLRHLRSVLTTVLPFADHSGALRILDGVRWHTDGDRLLFVATDRYTAARVALPLPEPIPMFEPFTMRLADAQRLLAVIKPDRGLAHLQEVTVSLGDETCTIGDASVLLTMKYSDGPYPDLTKIWTEVFADAKGSQPSAPRGLNTRFVSRFTQGRESTAVFWPAQPNRPQLVTVSETFCGLIMPVRVEVEGQLELLEADFNRKPAKAAPAKRSRAKKVA